MRTLLGVIPAILALVCGSVRGQPPEDPLPMLIGLLNSPSSGTLLCFRWTDGTGATLQAWKRIGQHVGVFEIVGLEEPSDTVLLRKSDARIYRIALPEGKVAPGLTVTDFRHIRSFLPGQENASQAAPVLTREKARAFWLRLLEDLRVPSNPDLVLDFTGGSLPPAKQEEFQRARNKAKADGMQMVLEVKADGEYHGNTIPINTFGLPEPMTRHLLESDWEELSSLSAGLMIRARTLSQKERSQK